METKKKILFAEDRDDVVNTYRLYFEEDYNLEILRSGDEAMARIERDVEGIDLIVLDGSMPPGPTGDIVARRCKELYPSVPVVLYTGDPEQYHSLPREGIPVLSKGTMRPLVNYIENLWR